jgi:hypothetical protein
LLLVVAVAACTPGHPSAQPPRTPEGVVTAVTADATTPAPSIPPGTGEPDPETGYAVPDELRARPLRAPTLAPGQGCPVDRPHPVDVAEVGDVAGPGPVYPGSLSPAGELRIGPPDTADFPYEGEYGGQKVGWLIDPRRYAGPVLIRGVRLDGDRAPDAVRFWSGVEPADAMQLPAGRSNSWVPGLNWIFWPSFTRLREPGCYAWQVDGLDFSYQVTFRATALRAGPR